MKSRRPEKQRPEKQMSEGATKESRETPAQVAARIRAYLTRKGYAETTAPRTFGRIGNARLAGVLR